MENSYDRACVASIVGIAIRAVFEGSERANERNLGDVSTQLLDVGCELVKLKRELLDLPPKRTAEQEQLDVPF